MAFYTKSYLRQWSVEDTWAERYSSRNDLILLILVAKCAERGAAVDGLGRFRGTWQLCNNGLKAMLQHLARIA